MYVMKLACWVMLSYSEGLQWSFTNTERNIQLAENFDTDASELSILLDFKT